MTEKEFFDWMRRQQDNHKLTQSMVDGAHELMALMPVEDVQAVLSKVNDWPAGQEMALSSAGAELIKGFEAFRSHPYRDQKGVPTIGYGNTYYPDRTPVTMADKPITHAEALELKQTIVDMDFAPALNMMFADEIERGDITQNMFDALMSLAYNIGTAGLRGSSVYRHIKAGHYKAAANAFLLWDKVRINGVLEKSNGLVERREKERKLFLS